MEHYGSYCKPGAWKKNAKRCLRQGFCAKNVGADRVVRPISLSKNLVEFRRARRNKVSIRFVRRRVRRTKHITCRKCGICAPTRTNITECEPSEVVHIRRGATTERTRPAACGGARNAQFVATRTQRSGSRLRACQKYFFDKLKWVCRKCGRPVLLSVYPMNSTCSVQTM